MLTIILTALFIFVAAIDVSVARGADNWPTSPAALRWRPPAGWIGQAWCLHRHESADWHRAGVDWAGNRSPYYGGMQFLLSTWQRAGGSGLPSSWSPREQLYRTFVIWRLNGGSFREWGTAAACGLR